MSVSWKYLHSETKSLGWLLATLLHAFNVFIVHIITRRFNKLVLSTDYSGVASGHAGHAEHDKHFPKNERKISPKFIFKAFGFPKLSQLF